MRKQIIVKNIKLPITTPLEDFFKAACRRAGIQASECLSAALHKRSIDARRRGGKDMPYFVASVNIECEISEKKLEKLTSLSDVDIVKDTALDVSYGTNKLSYRPLIVGFGPAGMFAALLLAENGYCPIVAERGSDVKERSRKVDEFIATGKLDTDTNIQFGAGGAGTFSDGKLVTRINDPRCSYILKRFVEFGAPEEIQWLAKPHVGTDRLLSVVDGIAERIISLGGEIRYNTKLTDLKVQNGKVMSAQLKNGSGQYEIPVDTLILAVGHSARDTYDMLAERGFTLLLKPFSVGVRAEHLQEDIDRMLYGDAVKYTDKNGKRILPPGEYSLSYRESVTGIASDNGRGVYSFCMCPGGEVMASASEDGGIVTNGMSRYARDGRNANAAIAVSVFPEDVGGGWRDGVEFQRSLEQRAFTAADDGTRSYLAPVETLGDFLEGKTSGFSEPTRVIPTYRDGKYTICDLSAILPGFVTDMLKVGFRKFGGRMRGFDAADTVLTGVETRTSSPVRILRGDGFASTHADNLYPCGEGAGYAGGITSAGLDGVNCALALMAEWKPFEGEA